MKTALLVWTILMLPINTMFLLLAYYTPTWNLKHTDIVLGWENVWNLAPIWVGMDVVFLIICILLERMFR